MIKIVKETLVESACVLGESPVWDSGNECLYWVDLLAGKLHRYDTKVAEHKVLDFKNAICSVARCSSGKLLIAFKRKLAVLNAFELDSLVPMTTLLPTNGVRFNDGQVDGMGRLWIGTMSETGAKGKGFLMKVNHDFKAKVEVRDIDVSNGMCWNSEKSQFYHVDTGKYQVTAYDYSEERGGLNNPRVIIRVPESWGKPDGMTIDREGMLWIALWGGWAVSRWDPETGSCIGMIDLPVSQVSSCVFGGNDFSELYITSASTGMDKRQRLEEPLAGAVFKVHIPGVQGLPANTFKL